MLKIMGKLSDWGMRYWVVLVCGCDVQVLCVMDKEGK